MKYLLGILFGGVSVYIYYRLDTLTDEMNGVQGVIHQMITPHHNHGEQGQCSCPSEN
jgi:hypothetical protein